MKNMKNRRLVFKRVWVFVENQFCALCGAVRPGASADHSGSSGSLLVSRVYLSVYLVFTDLLFPNQVYLEGSYTPAYYPGKVGEPWRFPQPGPPGSPSSSQGSPS